MRRELAGRRVLVTGASSGIGKALAEALAAEKARVVIAARNQSGLEQVAATLRGSGAEVHVVAADISKDDERARLIDEARQALGGLDVLINNAGIGTWGPFIESNEKILRQVMEVNFFAPADLIRRAIPILVEGTQPAVVNVASMCGRCAMPGWVEYSSSKFALCGLTEALRGEFARFDIDILLMVPGLTASDFSDHLIESRVDEEEGVFHAHVGTVGLPNPCIAREN